MKQALQDFLDGRTNEFPVGIRVRYSAKDSNYNCLGVSVLPNQAYPKKPGKVLVRWNDSGLCSYVTLYDISLDVCEMALEDQQALAVRNKIEAFFSGFATGGQVKMPTDAELMRTVFGAPRSKQPQTDVREYVAKLDLGDKTAANVRKSLHLDPALEAAKETYRQANGATPTGSRPGDTGSARKMDAGKAPVMQGFIRYFPNAALCVSMVSEYGDRKYAIHPNHYTTQWLDVPDGLNRYGDAEARHNFLRQIEGEYDIHDSGLPHLAQKAWNAMAELERAIKDGKVEIMRGNDIVNGKPVLGTARKA